ncbi:MAG TPA: CdaR family protein [Candidatus Limnocylindrales bacterium]
MRRAANFLLRNWPLKLGAVLLATVLYSGLVLGQNVRSWTGQVPVDAIRPPQGATLINDLDPVTTIRFRAPIDVGVLSPDSFRATVDLSGITAETGGAPVPVPITVIALDQRVQIVDFQPREEQVQLDPVAARDLPVTVTLGTVPDSVTVGPPQVDPQSVTVRGASSRVNAVSQVVARVPIDASALNVDRDVDLVAVDANGNQVPSVEIDPQRVHVTIAVAQELSQRTLPVVPQLTGAPAPGYKVTSITVNPLVVTVSGEAATVSTLENAQTQPIDLTGRTSDLEAQIGLALPAGLTVSGSDKVSVVLTIAQDTGTQTFGVGVTLQNEQLGYSYALSSGQVHVTFGGPTTTLASFDATQLVATADVAGAGPGDHILRLTVQTPPGMSLVSIDPPEVTVTISAPPSPSPSPQAVPTP